MTLTNDRLSTGRAGSRLARTISLIAIMTLALAFCAGAWAQSSATVSFATIGMQSGVSVTLNVSYTDPAGNPVSGNFTFTAPSGAIATAPGTSVVFSFPSSLTDGTATYTLDRVFTASPITTGAAGTTTTVQARYGLLVDFAASGLPDGTSLSAVVSYTNGRGIGISNQTVAITTPNASAPIITQLGTSVTFTYPSSVTASDGKTYPLVSVSLPSGFITGAAGTTTHVVANYGSSPPTVTAASGQTANEGASTSFDLGSFVDPDGGPWSVDVDWGDVSTHTTFMATSAGPLGTRDHTYADNGPYTVMVKVTDSTNLSDQKSFVINVANVAPTPSMSGAPDSSPEGTAISLTGSATDASPVDTAVGFTFGWSVTKNGSPFATGSGASFSFTPDDNGSYVVTLTATDKDSGVGSTSATIAVTNVAPTAVINGAPATSPEGTSIALSSTVSDPSTADTTTGFNYAWTVTKNGNPFASGSEASFTFTPDDDGTYLVTLAAKDQDGGTGSDSKTITVTNIAPSVADLTAPVSVLVNQSLTVSTTFGDPGADYPWQATFDWGDGSTPVLSPVGPASGPAVNVPLSLSHSYSSNATWTIQVSVTDKNGATGPSNLKSVKVLYNFAALFDQSQSSKAYKKGSTIPIKIQILDFNGNVSSPGITVHAVGLAQTSISASADVLDSGNANPDSDFRFDIGLQGYIFNLSTRNLSTGTWTLSFTVNGQVDTSYVLTFEVR
jgi:hypothetical protein